MGNEVGGMNKRYSRTSASAEHLALSTETRNLMAAQQAYSMGDYQRGVAHEDAARKAFYKAEKIHGRLYQKGYARRPHAHGPVNSLNPMFNNVTSFPRPTQFSSVSGPLPTPLTPIGFGEPVPAGPPMIVNRGPAYVETPATPTMIAGGALMYDGGYDNYGASYGGYDNSYEGNYSAYGDAYEAYGDAYGGAAAEVMRPMAQTATYW